ncbi:MAG: Crp/Fnr family transcriptional regulator [Gammaproteobacteria bacterium]|nr:Crp/Fnr family transcriptional regulator [Gammaproteobacteria bacterium]NIR81960.1 Crp/Fnr family transcriptional regulator [Gammaproteobacteria bacterium]NIR89012.1 Crp/Fnr family transcriptional regulator [Gammaproteobacteria bacterium]NIU03067.1 Crp/Fnr family transcriptional regulator [Gammaproteobacteria bacterium]NIV50591.1 cyclic nucleotide-binding domain-containing protein [Gammaproteobacteria bacterium]
MVDPTDKTLLGIDVFRTLSPDDCRVVASRCHWHRYAAGQQILSYPDTSTEVYFIVGGKVRVTLCSPSGREVTFRDLGSGQMFGDLSAIDGKGRSANVVALTDSLVAAMPSNVFREVRHEHPEVAEAVLQEAVRLVRHLSERVFEFGALGVKNRIHAELLRLARAHMRDERSAEIRPAPIHADIASRVCTHREAVSRELSELQRAGLVERRRGALLIHDVPRLTRMVTEVRGD